jgi:iron complex outermembrane recepter protein
MKVESRRNVRAALLLLIAAALAGFGGSLAFAEDEGSASPGVSRPADTGQLQEIVVTAQRRTQSQQDVPIAVAAFTADQAQRQGISDPLSLAQMVPGLTFNRQSLGSVPFLRGVGTSIGQYGDEPSIAFYVDDVYMAEGSASIGGFNSIDRLEVEKGPQGTLFGRNATGGVIQVFTKDPTPEPAADLSAGYGNYNTRSASIYATSALTDTLSANFAAYGTDQGTGWGVNLATGKDVFTTKQYGGRAKLLWTPSDTTSALLIIDTDTTNSQVGGGFHPAYGTVPFGGFAPPSGFYDVNSDLQPDGQTHQSGVSLKVMHEFGWAKLTSISAYRKSEASYSFDEDLSPLPVIGAYVNFSAHTLSQEFRLESQPRSALSWITGFFYMHDLSQEYPLDIFGEGTAPLPDGFIGNGTQATNSYSGFADATATILPDTRLTGGLRYTVDERDFSSFVTFPEVPGAAGLISFPPDSKTFEKLTYRANLDHRFTPDVLGYVAYNRGFKSGFFNLVVSPSGPTPAVNPEVLDAYSIGAKSEWFDHKLKINPEAFLYKYKNIQTDEVVNGGTVLYNAAAATIKGVDLDIQAVPVDRLTLSASFEVLDGHYDSCNCVVNVYLPGQGILQTSGSDAGKHTVESSPFSFSASVNYVIPTEHAGSFSMTAALSHFGNYYADPDNGKDQIDPSVDRQPLVNPLNLRLDWTSPDARFVLSLWGKNVTGEKYTTQILNVPFGVAYSPAAPATYGLTATYHFGT